MAHCELGVVHSLFVRECMTMYSALTPRDSARDILGQRRSYTSPQKA